MEGRMFQTLETSFTKIPKRGNFGIFKALKEDHCGRNGVNEKESVMR